MKCLFIFCVIMLQAGYLEAQWIHTPGPYGTSIQAFASNGSDLYAGSENGGVFYSSNSGSFWVEVDFGVPPLMYGRISSLLVNGLRLFAGVQGSGVYLTTNGGASWEEKNNGLSALWVNALAMYDLNLFAATSGGVFLSTNGGQSWTSVRNGMSNIDVRALIFKGTNLFAGTSGGGVFLSTDNGSNWTAVDSGLTNPYITSFAVLGTEIYAGTDGSGVYRSTDDGSSWALTGGFYSNNIQVLAMGGTNLYAGTSEGGVYITTDRGANWTAINSGLVNTDIRALLDIGSRLIAGTRGAGVYVSTNQGTTWESRSTGLTSIYVYALHRSGELLFAGTYGAGIYVSSDGGNSWASANTGVPPMRPEIRAFAEIGPNLFAGSYGGGVLLSTNRGSTWRTINTGLPTPYILSFAVKGTSLLTGTYGGGIFVTTDNGESWTGRNSGLTNNLVNSIAVIGERMFAGTWGGGVFISTDEGLNWDSVSNGLPNLNIRALASIGGSLFAISWPDTGMYRSTNYGRSWNAVNVAPYFNQFLSIAAFGQYLFAGSIGSPIFLSSDLGNTWSEVGNGLIGSGIYALSASESDIFAGSSNGVWRRPFGEMLTSGSVSGNVFNDLNGNGAREPGDSSLAQWKIYLKHLDNIAIDSVLTDYLGGYFFTIPLGGNYIVSEFQDSGWIQTAPLGLGSYNLAIFPGTIITGADFGNAYGYKYIGPTHGNWSDSLNWQGGVVPGPDKFVAIPPDKAVTVDSLPKDSIAALRVETGASLTFPHQLPILKVREKVEINNSGQLLFTSGTDSTGIISYGDWMNRGSIDPGHSRVRFAGNKPKFITSVGGQNVFYKLEIAGDNTNMSGIILVKNQLVMTKGIAAQDPDSIIIDNDDIGAIQDTGKIFKGTIKRRIKPGETGIYRFESPNSYIKFSGTGINPIAVSMSAMPDMNPANLLWEEVGGNLDTLNNIITADSLGKFSRWAFGIPRATSRALLSGQLKHIDAVKRVYTIRTEGGSNYTGRLRLRYDQAEVPPIITESQLKLFHGPFLTDSVQPKWNLLSIPLVPENGSKDSIFPTAVSAAFQYGPPGYMMASSLQLGKGYWLKFSSPAPIRLMGDDRDFAVIPVNAGWNMIGSISYPVAVPSVATFPPNNTSSYFYGYSTSYMQADSIRPFEGYWIKVKNDGELVLSAQGNNLLEKGNTAQYILKDMSYLKVSDSKENTQVLYYGEGGGIDLPRFELPPLPPEGVYDVRYASGRNLEIAGADGNSVAINIKDAEYPLNISWQTGINQKEAILRIGAKDIELKNAGEVKIKDSALKIQLLLAPSEVNPVPREFALWQNYPNPFNPVSVIRYALPENSRVRLIVYDIIGQEMRVLVDAVQNSGYQSVQWNAGNCASGVYFYRLEASSMQDPGRSFVGVKKAILLK